MFHILFSILMIHEDVFVFEMDCYKYIKSLLSMLAYTSLILSIWFYNLMRHISIYEDNYDFFCQIIM